MLSIEPENTNGPIPISNKEQNSSFLRSALF